MDLPMTTDVPHPKPEAATGAPVDLSIIIVNYNTRDLTLDCLRSVYEQTQGISFEVLLVDNASQDGSAAAIAAAFPEVRLFPSQENLGFGKANNLAAEQATGEWILLLNSDTVVLDRAIERLLSFARTRDRAGLYGGKTEFADGRVNPTGCFGRVTLWSEFALASGLTTLFRGSPIFNPRAAGARLGTAPCEVGIITGCFVLTQRSLWRRLGGFDPRFFMFAEDFDLSMRAAALGAEIMVDPGARIIHYGGASESSKPGRMSKMLRAQAQLFAKHWPPWKAALGVRCLDLQVLVRRFGFACMAPFSPRARALARDWSELWRSRSLWREELRLAPEPMPKPDLVPDPLPGAEPCRETTEGKTCRS